MSTSPAIRVSAQGLQTFEPLRLGSRTPEFRRLITKFAGQKQSAILHLIEDVVRKALDEGDDDVEAIALTVTLLVLRDYVTAGNYPIDVNGSLFLANLLESESLSADNQRALLRRQYEAARSRALRDRGHLSWLRDALRTLHHGGYAPHDVVGLLRQGPPEIILVDTRESADGIDPRSLWRCVRATWSMGPEASAPGRELAFLVVDKRAPATPLGILQFRNVVPEIRMRDLWFGTAVGTLATRGAPGSGFLGLLGSGAQVRLRLLQTTTVLRDLLRSINPDGIPVPLEVNSISALGDVVRLQRQLFDETRQSGDQGIKNEHLRIHKRAQTAHGLLRGIRGLGSLRENFATAEDESVRSDIDAGLTKLWHYHMGFVAIEMSICGASPPFGPMRVGKLVAALAGSRPVLDAWGWDRPLGQISQEVYLPSVRERVPNPGPLVVFTSGLYPGHSAQYSRVKSGPNAWRKIGETTGYGGFHIAFETTEALRRLNRVIDGYTHVTRTFGEGSGARFRSVGRGLDYLGLPDLRKHETKRPLYALPTVANPREVLLGWEQPKRLSVPDPTAIGLEWHRRWLEPRLDELIDVARHSIDLEGALAEIVGNAE